MKNNNSRHVNLKSTALSPDWPPAILVCDSHVLVVTYGDMALFDRAGKPLWERAKQGGTPITVANGLIYHKSKTLFLDAINLDNETVLNQAPFPSAMSSEVEVKILWPRPGDFIAAVFSPGQQEVADGDAPGTRPHPQRYQEYAMSTARLLAIGKPATRVARNCRRCFSPSITA